MDKIDFSFDTTDWQFDNPDGTVRDAVFDEETGEFYCMGCGEVIPVEAIYGRISFDIMMKLFEMRENG